MSEGLSRPQVPCAAPGCPQLVASGYCAAHVSRATDYDRARGSSARRGYDAVWKRFRVWFFSCEENHYCRDCSERGALEVLATEIHHLKKVRDYPALRFHPENCRPLCKTCHTVRTNRGE